LLYIIGLLAFLVVVPSAQTQETSATPEHRLSPNPPASTELSNEARRLLERKPALEDAAETLMRSFNVDAHEHASVFFDLARAEYYAGNLQEALEAYETGLRLDPTNERALVEYGQIALFLDQKRLAYETLDALRNVENAQVARTARQVMKEYSLAYPDDSVVLPELEGYRLVLVRIGRFPERIVRSVRHRLEREFNIEVEVADGILSIPQRVPRREKWNEFLERAHRHLVERNSKDTMRRLYRDLDIDPEGTLSRSELERIYRAVVRSAEKPNELYLSTRYGNVDQYDAEALVEVLRSEFETKLKDPRVLGVLALTDHDIYRGDLRYLFAFRSGEVAVMSSHRFLTPNTSYTKILNRIITQAMTSTVHIFNVDRATHFPCATAYPNSLQQFDRKEDRLCPAVRRALAERYRELSTGS
jgi:predicted Zn-dependent protease